MYLKDPLAVGDLTFERVSNSKYLGVYTLINNQIATMRLTRE